MRQRSFRKQDSFGEPDAILEQDAVGHAHVKHHRVGYADADIEPDPVFYFRAHFQHNSVGYADAKHDYDELGHSYA